MNMKKYKTKIFLTMMLGVLSVCLFTGCSNNVEPGKFVTISTDGIIAYSTDGIKWTESDELKKAVPLLGSAYWYRICYGDGKFVAITGEGNQVAYSTDGETWSAETIKSLFPHSNQWGSLTYGNGKFVAVSWESDQIAAYSTNGKDWNATRNLPTPATWASVCYGIGMFVAIAEDGETAYSTNGINWTPGGSLPSGITWHNVCYGKGKFVAMTIGGGSKVEIAYSTNGINWITGKEEWPDGYIQHYYASCYGNGKFVMIGNSGGEAVYSTDGIRWRPTKIDAIVWEYVCYGNGLFIATEIYGQMAYSEDGINWNIGKKLSTPSYSHNWASLTYGLDNDVFGFL